MKQSRYIANFANRDDEKQITVFFSPQNTYFYFYTILFVRRVAHVLYLQLTSLSLKSPSSLLALYFNFTMPIRVQYTDRSQCFIAITDF